MDKHEKWFTNAYRWVCRNGSIERQDLDLHETRLEYLVKNLLKNKNTVIITRTSSHLDDIDKGISITINPTGSGNDVVVVSNGITSNTQVSDFACRRLTNMIVKETAQRLSKITNMKDLQEKEKLKTITDRLYEKLNPPKLKNG